MAQEIQDLITNLVCNVFRYTVFGCLILVFCFRLHLAKLKSTELRPNVVDIYTS